VTAIDTRAIGVAVIGLGGGRRLASDAIDHRVGFTELAGKGAGVDSDKPLAIVHAKDAESAETASAAIRAAYILGSAAHESTKPVRARIKDSTP